MLFDVRPLTQSLIALWTVIQSLGEAQGGLVAAVNAELMAGPLWMPSIVLIFFVAGLSESFGTRAVVLFLNRVGRRPFWIALLLTALTYVAGGFVWGATTALVVDLFYDLDRVFLVSLRAIAVGFLPLLFAFLGFTPYLGQGLLIFLQGLSLFLAALTLSLAYGLPFANAALCATGGWVLFQIIRWFTAGPVTLISRWLLRQITGQDVDYGLRDVVPSVPLGLRRQN
jgi:hypothetical protein